MLGVCSDRNFLVTAKGYLGLGPRGARKGDLVCVVYGCPVPLLIRLNRSEFEIVGDAYVYGIMKGEVMDQVKEGSLSAEDVTFI
ncbi:hypothetical protein B0T26DRAFT_635749 [Lasiosphaeria miniovina]|uniref:Uncharacterized protein n=1 Tax=Lasiosphaeria miniovina TaxID=1954250 RepID=A0AA40BF67_9PEZI|nr:uncharacterized protein B0T26DRAFT_635749 [Lasiosphaeria miniovina]KAK0733090.1 hypothetical protein B0T26DRAFT_635749 [Lasiosphaeria miniovina]